MGKTVTANWVMFIIGKAYGVFKAKARTAVIKAVEYSYNIDVFVQPVVIGGIKLF
jgi:hypothetical protein